MFPSPSLRCACFGMHDGSLGMVIIGGVMMLGSLVDDGGTLADDAMGVA